MPDAILEARRVSFAYRGTPVLEDISLDVRPGELLGITGINGSGKTTLLKLLGGLLRPQCGEVALDGRGLHALGRNAIARRISLVPQDIPVESSFTVRDIVAMGRNPYLGRFGQETRIDRQAVEMAVSAADIAGLEDRLLRELSGGEQKRVFIARALAQETAIIMLDEPTANLDLAHQLTLIELLSSLCRKGRAVVLSMHDLSFAATHCDRVLVLANNGVGSCGTPGEVITPDNLARFFGVQAEVLHYGGCVSVVPLRQARRSAFDKPV
ncbi:MAG TPA: ABC transporter ATP-binding protein [Oligoflexia bacterium]|nr:ABC transporter ATP-binding protein [Oligoflexia bacterium]